VQPLAALLGRCARLVFEMAGTGYLRPAMKSRVRQYELEDVMNQYETTAAMHADAEPESPAGTQAQGQVEEVARRAQDAAGNAQIKVRDQIDHRSTQVGEQVAASAQALRAGADELVKQGNRSAADAANRAAAQAERLGSYLRDADASRILADVEDVARRNPWAVALGGAVAGVAAARFLKASSSRRYQAARIGTSYGGGS
jgi:hypothetical protein